MSKIFNSTKAFLIPCFFTWVVMTIAVLVCDKAQLHLFISGYRSSFLDSFMYYYTEVGGSLPWVVAGFLLFYRFGASLIVVITQLIVTIPVQLLKRNLDIDRPRRLFEQLHLNLPQVAGMELHSSNSFPSGHTASAFALFLCLCFFVKNSSLKFLFFVLALLVAYSRVYLSQHFVNDVLAGSVIGVMFPLLYMYYSRNMNFNWMEKSLLRLKSKKE